MRDRYADDPLARFDLIASSKDKESVNWDVVCTPIRRGALDLVLARSCVDWAPSNMMSEVIKHFLQMTYGDSTRFHRADEYASSSGSIMLTSISL